MLTPKVPAAAVEGKAERANGGAPMPARPRAFAASTQDAHVAQAAHPLMTQTLISGRTSACRRIATL